MRLALRKRNISTLTLDPSLPFSPHLQVCDRKWSSKAQSFHLHYKHSFWATEDDVQKSSYPFSSCRCVLEGRKDHGPLSSASKVMICVACWWKILRKLLGAQETLSNLCIAQRTLEISSAQNSAQPNISWWFEHEQKVRPSPRLSSAKFQRSVASCWTQIYLKNLPYPSLLPMFVYWSGYNLLLKQC